MKIQNNYFVDHPNFIELMSFPNRDLHIHTHSLTRPKPAEKVVGFWKVKYKNTTK